MGFGVGASFLLEYSWRFSGYFSRGSCTMHKLANGAGFDRARSRSPLWGRILIGVFVLSSIACGSLPSADTATRPRAEQQQREQETETNSNNGVIASEAPESEQQAETEAAPPATTERNSSRNGVTELPAAPPPEALSAEENELVGLYERVGAGVVSISVATARGGGAGSGFIVDTDGHIVTNDHVVAGAQEVIVTFSNGLQARAEVLGTDEYSDLAVIRVEELPEGVVALEMADSGQVRVGQQTIAIGNPFGLQSTLTTGIVSAVGRSIPSLAANFQIPLAIQTDAAINPGNSGGPLLNSTGQVIGVNSQIQTTTGTNAGIGFAVPSNIVRRVVPMLIQQGRYDWPYLGVSGLTIDLAIAETLGLPVRQGAYVTQVISGGPADRAGLRGAETQIRGDLQVPVGGDIIIAANGEQIRNWDELLSVVAFQQAGDTMELTVLRDGREARVPVQLGSRPRSNSQQQLFP
jgi:S1-C subfamily serine protease